MVATAATGSAVVTDARTPARRGAAPVATSRVGPDVVVLVAFNGAEPGDDVLAAMTVAAGAPSISSADGRITAVPASGADCVTSPSSSSAGA